MWTLETGLKLVRALDNQAMDFGFHLALGGSVLRKGESTKDIDLYLLPYDNESHPENMEGLVAWLTRIWGTPVRLGPDEGYGPSVPRMDEVRAIYDPERGRFEAPTLRARPARPAAPKSERYKDKLKFVRPGGERIDVFIM